MFIFVGKNGLIMKRYIHYLLAGLLIVCSGAAMAQTKRGVSKPKVKTQRTTTSSVRRTSGSSVSSSISGVYYKDVAARGGEYLSISYDPYSGRATAVYAEEYSWGTEQHFDLSGYASGGYLVLSGYGVSHGRSTSMKVRVCQSGSNGVRVVTGNGHSYYFYR